MKPARSILLRRAPIKWAPIGKKVLRYEQYRIEDEARQHTVLRSFEYAALDKKKKYGGRERLENLERALDYLFTHGVVLGKIQEKIIHEVIVTFLKNMFVDDLVSNLKFLTEKYLIKELIDTLALLLPRRIGKTVSCAIIIATIAVSQPFGNVVIYNLSAAQAEEFIGLVTKYLNIFKDSVEFGWIEIKRDVRKHIFIKNKKYGVVNTIKSYACALRGDGKIDKTIFQPFFF